jgi:DNA-binding transcriptional regulator YiaG
VTRSWKSLERARLSRASRARVQERVESAQAELSLAELRRKLELTQVQLARAADMTQSELSRIEARRDHLTSTLRRYVEALGGQLEVSAVIGGRRITLTDA